jgi:hypothetical protein
MALPRPLTFQQLQPTLACTWSTHVKLNSDLLPITITFSSNDIPSNGKGKSYTNFNKADWPAFIRETEMRFRDQHPPTSVGAGEKIFQHIVLAASRHCIPAGYCHSCVPGISREAAALNDQCNTIRANDPLDRCLPVLNRDITKVVAENRRQIWRDKVEAAG